MRQWLVGSAHDAESNVLIAFLHEGGNDGMEWAFPWSEDIGRSGIEREQRTAILQDKPHSANRNSRTKRFIVALYQGNDIAFPIHY